MDGRARFDGLVGRLRDVAYGARAAIGARAYRDVGPRVALRWARDYARGFRGALSVLHLHAMAGPAREALVTGARRISFGEFHARVVRLTHVLTALGLQPGHKIAISLKNGNEALELAAAVAGIGAIGVPMSWRSKRDEIAYFVESAHAQAFFFDASLAPAVRQVLTRRGHRLEYDACVAVGGASGFSDYETLLAQAEGSWPALRGGGYGGLMVFTSGTTGRSKGAARDFSRMFLSTMLDFIARIGLRRDERHLVLCPLHHSMAPALALAVTSLGGCNIVMDEFDAERVLAAIETERVTSMLVVPTMLERILALPKRTRGRYDLSSLRAILSGAAPLSPELAIAVEDFFGPILYNFYGATETGIVTLAVPGDHRARPGTIGRVIGDNRVRVLDDAGRDCAPGEVGELYVRSGMLMSGYYGHDAATAAGTREGYFSVGDLVSRDEDGYFYLADRKSDVIISGGVNIYPWEIEQRLLTHEAIAEAAVVGVPDREWGEAVAAFVVKHAGKQVSAEALRVHVGETLSDVKRPRRVVFLAELPRTTTGKVLRRELRQRWISAIEENAR